MIIKDRIYGSFELESVLIDLIQSKPMQRLKGIHQGGASYLVNPNWNVTRYEHSVGVMLLIRSLGGSIEEQIAGLLHDISHTAFSHVVDFALDNVEENYHEEIFQEIFYESEIPAILRDYEFTNIEMFTDESNWPLLEQPLPVLCADRVDYTLRDLYTYGYITRSEVQIFLSELIVVDNRIAVKNIKTAEWFVDAYYKEVIDFFLNPYNVYAYDQLTKILKYAFENKYMCLKDLQKQDEEVLSILKEVKDDTITSLLSKLNQHVRVVEDQSEYDIHLKTKPRIIDPYVLTEKGLQYSSKLSSFVRLKNEKASYVSNNGMKVKIN
ncbi:hypothetical protein HNQ94_002582 [Salirhabdus euzebyi]|uniref:HD domain-containing protein n=1 Tax=Salirhabdus euzebyi TaxID=394506 RepID=A0A841Q6U9_9BACI|nr:HD domain-containing protein [Salirhabdus euzebyi]MBB6454131.1 hypothetical protein [Salirhabdus euzebyi]